MRLFWLMALGIGACALVAGVAKGQTTGEPTYIVRIETAHPGENTCVLVRADGFYHLEEITDEDGRIFEGWVPAREVEEVVKVVNLPEFGRLSQHDIPAELIVGNLNEVFVAVFRDGGVQNLRWLDAESFKPYKQLVGPLVEWLRWVQKQQHTELSEDSGRTNCLPPAKIELRTRSEHAVNANPSATDGAGKRVPSQDVPPVRPYLVWMSVKRFDEGRATRNCVIVYADGEFRKEETVQVAGAVAAKTRAFVDNVPADDLASLRSILNAPELKSLQHPFRSRRISAREAQITSVDIPRGDAIQRLGFGDYYGIFGSDVRQANDNDEQAISPLQHWIKHAIGFRRSAPIPDSVGTNCAPMRIAKAAASK